MSILSALAPLVLLLVGFVLSVSAGAARDTDLLSPARPLTVFLVAAILLTLQAVLWVRLGTHL